jgi:hypothetical protein
MSQAQISTLSPEIMTQMTYNLTQAQPLEDMQDLWRESMDQNGPFCSWVFICFYSGARLTSKGTVESPES